MALRVLHTLFATLYLPPLYRAMGAKIGHRTEISTATNMTHDLLEIGDEAFVADSVVLGDSRIRHGVITLRRTRLGDRCFAGNAAVVPDGCNLPSGTLLGVLSLAPDNMDSASRLESTWFGIPSSELPRRETFLDYPEELTFRPSRTRWFARAAVEMVRIILPSTLIICELILLTAALYDISERFGLAAAIAGLPFLYLAIVVLPSLAIVVALKWVLIGRYKSGAHPMWTPFVWFSEAVTTVVEMLLNPLLMNPLRGTPFLAWPLRLLGVKIGRRTLINTTDITEFDMVKIGDHAVLSDDCGPQTHLFEDRVMKVGPVTIGARAVVGARAIPLYDTIMGDGSYLAPQSLLMKGEELPDNSRWSGAPAEPL
jgi:non-ribosomal peptide synthetase-like protein